MTLPPPPAPSRASSSTPGAARNDIGKQSGKPKPPVGALARKALTLPFHNLKSFVVLASVPVALTFAAQATGALLSGLTGFTAFRYVDVPVAALLGVPLTVAWTKLAVEGAASIVNRPKFRFGPVEVRYATAGVLIICLFGPPAVAVWWASESHWAAVPLTVAVCLGAVELIVGWRMIFILPLIALGRYRGIRAAFQQSKRVHSLTFGVLLYAMLPFGVAQRLLLAIALGARGHLWALSLVVLLLHVLRFLRAAVSSGALGLCYKYSLDEKV